MVKFQADFALTNLEVVLYIKLKMDNQLKPSFVMYKEHSLMVKQKASNFKFSVRI